MSSAPISRFPVPDLDSLPPDMRERILAVQEKAGFVPNIFLALAHRPAEFRAFFDYHDALMESNEGLSKAEREMIVVATSGANDCLYCVVAHGAILRIRAKNPRLADQLATNHRKGEITPEQQGQLEQMAGQRRQSLDALPKEPAGRIRGLQSYEFMDPDAHRMFWELMQQLQQQMLQPFMQGMQRSLQNMTPEDMARMREMLRDLEVLYAAYGLQAHFEAFMAHVEAGKE